MICMTESSRIIESCTPSAFCIICHKKLVFYMIIYHKKQKEALDGLPKELDKEGMTLNDRKQHRKQ